MTCFLLEISMLLTEKHKLFFKPSRTMDAKYLELDEFKSLGFKNYSNYKNVFFESNSFIESNILAQSTSIFFGAFSYMNEGGYIRSNVFVGRFCSIGRRVSIGAGIHSLTALSTSPFFSKSHQGSNYTDKEINAMNARTILSTNTTLMNDVWVGDGAIIMPGVTIGTGSVIGANSVVTRDVPPYAIFAGAPAKFIRFRVDESLIPVLLNTQWWECPPDFLKKLPANNIYQVLDAPIPLGHLYETYCIN